MRRFGQIFLLVSCLIGGLYIYVQSRLSVIDQPLNSGEGAFHLVITPGMSFKQVAARLNHAGIIKDSTVFEWYGRWLGVDRSIKAGSYTIEPHWTPKQLLEKLKAGTLPRTIRITLPEGLNRWQMADRLSAAGLIERDAFLRRIRMEALEGRLFPDTYLFRPKVQTNEVIARLTKKFDQVWQQVSKTAGKRLDEATKTSLVILASLVQKESGPYADQRKVARVFQNRLKAGMKLQTDPTCVYSRERYDHVPSPKDCHNKENAYSTYVIKGLPPGPIGNPGRSALRAVLSPYSGLRASKLLYFVARRDGTKTHHFSESYSDHQQAIRRFLKPRKTTKARH